MDDFTRLQLLAVPVEPDLSTRFEQFVKESQKLTPEQLAARLKQEGAKVHPEPSEAQKEDGNYRKGHVPWKGLDISIETARGQYRRGVSKDGKPWATLMKDHYGYLRGTKSEADGDAVDIFLCADHPHSDIVFVVNQRDPASGAFDEHKVILGTVDVESAKKVYLRNYAEGWQGMGEVTPMTVDHFKWWLENADTSKEFKNGYFAAPANRKSTKQAAYGDGDPRKGVPCPHCGSTQTHGARAMERHPDGRWGFANTACIACDNGFGYDFDSGKTSTLDSEPSRVHVRVRHLKSGFDKRAADPLTGEEPEDRSKLPYRDRAEMYALKDGKVFGSVYPDNGAFGVFGGGIDPGENPLTAAAREFQEESGWKVKNPRLLPFDPHLVEWNPPFASDKQKERAKQFRGSRTFYVAGDLDDQIPDAKIDELGRKDVRLYDLDEALKLAAPTTESATLTAANARRAEILKHLKALTKPKTPHVDFDPADAEKLASDDALGIPDRSNFGDLSKLKPGDLTDFVVQHHHAEKAGPHFDMRLGTPETGLYSWATRHDLPKPKEKRLWVQQPLHAHSYGGFEGTIPEGYGKGEVKKHAQRQIMLTKVGPGEIHFTTADKRHPERFALVQTKDRHWLMLNTTPTEPLPYQKIHYAKIPGSHVEETLQKLQPGSSVQAKVDGASSLVKLLKDGVELVSYRAAKETGHPIIHTERFFQGARPKLRVPPELVGTVLRGELYGVKNQGDKEESIHPSELGGVLNATLANSLAAQKAKGIRLKNMLFDIQQHGKTPVDLRHTPYGERRKMLEEVLQKVPLERFHLPDEVHDPDQAVKLWQDITSGKHPVTQEGVVVHPHTGKPMKAKPRPDFDVHLTGIFPGEGKYQGSGAGGFTYALQPGGPTIGKVGTGLSDEMRRELLADPDSYLGRVARITAQEQLPSGAYRAPSFIAFHEDYPQHKQASDGYVPHLVLVKRAKDEDSPFTIAVDLDGTLAKKEEPFNPRTIGKPRPRALYWLRLFHAAGARIIIFTVRGDNDMVEDWLEEHDVPYHYVNENPDQPEDSSGKVIADAYWDDRGYNAEDPDENGPLLLQKILAHGQEGEEEKGPVDGPAQLVVSVHKTLIIAAPDILQALEVDHEQGCNE